MGLVPGSRLGPYEIVAAIGAGGMGEVYRATDSNLKRTVAIKVLPAAVAGDPDRLARFQREAEVLAALNHPNIAAIYGLEKTPAVTALVMELVEGEDLAERLARGAIALDDALPIANQIAEALEAAHERGIIHRDLKPANIKVRTDGTAKVLDFGLAKAIEPAVTGAGAKGTGYNVSMSPTLTSPAMTSAGMILGTAAYMAPEQARGKAVDKRADIWAFGVVLYEMLAGRRPFAGEDASDVLVAVLNQDVDLRALPATTPSRVVALIRDCLIRDPKLRLRDIGDARIVIARLMSGPADEEGVSAPPGRGSASIRFLPWALVSALALAAVAMLIAWAPWRSQQSVDRPLVRLDVDLGPGVSLPTIVSSWGTIAVSPDSRHFVYASGTPPRLFIRHLDQARASELPGTAGVSGQPFFSADSQWVGFSAGGKVSKISVEGGAVVPLGSVTNFGGAAWVGDSLFVGEPFGRGLLRFPAEGGSATPIVVPEANAVTAVPQPLPDGKAVLFASCAMLGTAADGCNVEALTLADGRRKVLIRGGHSPHYLPGPDGSGFLIYINKATLFAVRFSPPALDTTGTAIPVLNDLAFNPTTGAGLFDVSATGTLIYRPLVASALATAQWLDPSGRKEPLRAKTGAYQDVGLAPDGKRIALTIAEGANFDIWAYDPQRDAMTRLTFGGNNRYPLWSPDGRHIVYSNFSQGLFQVRADGASPPQALTDSKLTQIPFSFSADGRRLAYFEVASHPQIWTAPIDAQDSALKAGTPDQFLKSNSQDLAPALSPDGRWLAYQSNESGRYEVYVRAFPPSSSGPGGKWQISNDGGTEPHWSRVGHDLVYRSGEQLMTVAYSASGDALVAEKPRLWIPSIGANSNIGLSWDLAPDGKRVAALIPASDANGQPSQDDHEIVMLQNFPDELARRVRAGK